VFDADQCADLQSGASSWGWRLEDPFTASSTNPAEAVTGDMARMGDEGKAVGCVPPTALLFEQAQYKISKSKYAVSIMAVTLATESIKASRAWW
jgi:hypothetical protein